MVADVNRMKRALRASIIGLGLFAIAPLAQTLAPQVMPLAVAQAEAVHAVKLAINKSAVIRLPAGVKDILVGNPEVAEVVLRSKRTMYIFARKLGETNIFLLDASGKPLTQLDLSVTLDPASLRRMLKKTLPSANINVEILNKQILLSGSVKAPADVNKAVQVAQQYAASAAGKTKIQVVNAIRLTGKDQVMIKVKLAEVQRDTLKQLRTNFSQISFTKGSLSGTLGLLFPFSLGTALGDSGADISYSGRNVQANAILQALERDGLMRLLAEPTLTAISGKDAKFVAGGEVPVVTGYDPQSGYTYSFKKFGVILGFTPVVLSESRISLKVNVEVSDISGRYSIPLPGGYAVPGFETRQVNTTVELPSGGSLALAGLFREQTRQNIDGIPGLKNLPVLGALFRSRDFQSNQSELMVLATPYIVTPRNEKKFRTPVDGLNAASDYQGYFLGRLHRVYGGATDAKGARKVYHGDVGMILD